MNYLKDLVMGLICFKDGPYSSCVLLYKKITPKLSDINNFFSINRLYRSGLKRTQGLFLCVSLFHESGVSGRNT